MSIVPTRPGFAWICLACLSWAVLFALAGWGDVADWCVRGAAWSWLASAYFDELGILMR